MKKRTKVRTHVGSDNVRRIGPDPRIVEALTKLDGALLCALSATVGVPYQGTMQHNLAIAARSATDIRSILMLGGEE